MFIYPYFVHIGRWGFDLYGHFQQCLNFIVTAFGIVQCTNLFPYTQVGNRTWHIITVHYFIAIAKPVTNNLLAKYNKT
jgi:hypothetical protein